MIVLLHGVPEAPRIWNPLRAALSPERTAVLELPGFTSAAPYGFGASMDDYSAWLTAQLETFDEPVDLVGHDWGSNLAVRAAATRPDLLRSWAVDATYMLHPDYRWHRLARVWQTPVAAQVFWLAYLSGPIGLVAKPYRDFGLSQPDAALVAAMGTRHMARSITRLYRSARPNIHTHWGDLADAAKVPGLVIHAQLDTFGSSAHTLQVAQRLGAAVVTYSDLGHWWALQDPQRAATTLTSFWASV